MERIRALINKLNEQSEQDANISGMMVTVQLIQAELTQLSSSAPQQMSTSKVAVLLPSSNKISFTNTINTDKESLAAPVTKAQAVPAAKEVEEPVAKTIGDPVSNNGAEPIAAPAKEIIHAERAEVEFEPANKIPARSEMAAETKKQDQSGWLFDPIQEIPTLAHQKEFKEMNDVFGGYGSSLNDKLKTERKELASVLNEGPVRDLKKAIGINDRFVFLSELFRGDEAMYERSIKTINNFRIYPEAEYWIERELKVKLGWDENKEAVKHFRQLVKRRFA